MLKFTSPTPYTHTHTHAYTHTHTHTLVHTCTQGMLQFTLSVIIETGKKCKKCDPTTEKIHHKLYELLGE